MLVCHPLLYFVAYDPIITNPFGSITGHGNAICVRGSRWTSPCGDHGVPYPRRPQFAIPALPFSQWFC
jgi:hypothetical protein